MKTAALLPTPGDTFVSRYWVRNYERVWKGEVDELFVFINGGTPEAHRAFESVGARVISEDRRVGHGEALDRLVQETDADVVVLVEDDAYVREKGAIASHLERAAQGEVIGSPRGGMSPELEVAALEKWGRVVSPDTSEGHGLWPCFLFVRTDTLRETDCRFEAQNWPDGSRVPGLNYHVHPGPLNTDTMTSVAFQLRARHPISLVGQWKEVHLKASMPLDAPWFHAGGLSTLDEWPRAGCGGSNEGRDWAHRAWWWERQAWTEPLYGPESPVKARMERVRRILQVGGLEEQFNEWFDVLLPWINWDDFESDRREWINLYAGMERTA